jgi:hypothetical protein
MYLIKVISFSVERKAKGIKKLSMGPVVWLKW